MNIYLLIGITGILVLGIAAQWLAWRINAPSILLLLIFGFLIGPVSGLINPDALFGDLLFPIVSLSVAVILYEGGLSLKLSEFREVGKVVRNLIIVGILLTWVLSAVAAHFILGLDMALAILLGAILVVTGPTVIMPLLRFVRPTGQVNSVLKWEGILNDPAGALLAVLVFEGILAGGIQQATTLAVGGLLETIFLGGGLGLLGAYVMMLLIKYHLAPEFLQNPVSLTLVFMVFAASNLIQAESGLFAVTIMGIFLANQKSVAIRHIIEFKENLRVLLISVLFIILAARLQLSDLENLGLNSLIFLAALILLIRPAAVFLSTIRTPLNWRERTFLAWMAPRGIVAAAVASIFQLELEHAGYPGAERLVAIMFLVIIGTIAVYGISALPLAKWLKIADANPQGALIIGAHPFAVQIAKTLQEQGFPVLMVDTNWEHVSGARMAGLATYSGSILSESIVEKLDLNGIGRMLAMTSNREVNSLAALYFARIFGNTGVYQLAIEEDKKNEQEAVSHELQGKNLFGWDITYGLLEERFRSGAVVKATLLTEEFDYRAFQNQYKNSDAIPFFLVDENKNLLIFSGKSQPQPRAGQVLIAIVNSQIA